MYEIHPVANIFPMMREEEFLLLKQDISDNGIIQPIWLHHDGRIIDGRNRYKACQELSIVPEVKTWDGKGSLVGFVVSLNKHRRHLSAMQLAGVAVDMLPMLEAEAKERQREAGGNHGNQYTKMKVAVTEKIPQLPLKETASIITTPPAKLKSKPKETESRQQAAKLLGTNERYVSDMKRYKEQAPQIYEAARDGKVNGSQAKEISKLDEDTQTTVLMRLEQEPEKSAKSIVRDEQKKKRVKIAQEMKPTTRSSFQRLEQIDRKYRIIYADPPWFYGNDFTQAMPGSTRPEDHYPTMRTEAICDLPIKNIVQDDSVLFLWGTSPLIPDALDVIKAWGFKYKTTFIWDKIKHNFGHYNSVRHEFLFVATRGSCTPDNNKLYDSVQSIERTEHSKKPSVFMEIIEDLYTYGERIELFARRTVDGWDTWGNEV